MAAPRMNLPAESVPWGRWASERIAELEKEVAQLRQAEVNGAKADTAILGAVSSLDVPTKISDALAAATWDMSQVPTGNLDQSRVSGTWTKDVSTSGTVRGDAGLASTIIYNNALTSGFRAVYTTNIDGSLGYLPSSRRFKEDITAVDLDDPLVALAIRLVTFRYTQAVEQLGDAAAVEWGVIAEEVHALGLTWLVDYDDEGEPFGIKYAMLALILLPALQNHEQRIARLEALIQSQ